MCTRSKKYAGKGWGRKILLNNIYIELYCEILTRGNTTNKFIKVFNE